jgi:hypothetical protein
MLGTSLLLAGDHEQLGPTGLSLSVGVDFFPPLLIYCLLIDDKCPHHLLGAKN